MSDNRETPARATVACLYKWPFGIDRNRCAYCGVQADTIDHVPPIEIAYCYGPSNFTSFEYWPACKQCNCVLGAKDLRTLAARKKEIARYLRRKYWKLLKMPYWTDEEIDDLGYNLRSGLNEAQIVKRFIEQRIRYATSE